MKAVFIFDINHYFKRYLFWFILLLLILFGFLGGQNARFSISEDIFDNSPYQISYITTLISLVTLFFSTVLAAQLLFRETDSGMVMLIFSSPIDKKRFLAGRYLALLSMSFLLTTIMLVSFYIGHHAAVSPAKRAGFILTWYLAPIMYFALINTLFVTAVLSFVAWRSRNKLMVYVSGLLLYIIYMIALIYSGSPMMAQSLPQSEQSQLISAIADPFGYSAFFHQTSHWTIAQRNNDLIALTGIFLYNRLGVVLLSVCLLVIAAHKFYVSAGSKSYKKAKAQDKQQVNARFRYPIVNTSYDFRAQVQALFSFVKMDLIWIVKSIPFVLTAISILFMVGMEFYAEIEKGVRIPQKYAGSGLMVSTIIQNFHVPAMITLLYYAHETYWRSRNANFNLIEGSTANIRSGLLAKCISLSIVLLLFSSLVIAEGILFQFSFQYPLIEWGVYGDVLLFNTFPLVLLGIMILLIQKWVNNKYIGLSLSAVFALLFATTLGKKIISYPLLKFLQPFTGDYSDMNGFAPYAGAYAERLLFGTALTAVFLIITHFSKTWFRRWPVISPIAFLTIFAWYSGGRIIENYVPVDKNAGLQIEANYELTYRKYQDAPQPVIIDVHTTVDLYPDSNAYRIRGRYTMKNKSASAIKRILIGVDDDMRISKIIYQNRDGHINISKHQQLLQLAKPLLPGDTASLEFDINYCWYAINGHKSFNAIVGNGAFMRISRYYPRLGYDADKEIQDENQRKQFGLGDATPVTSLNAPKALNNDFINLDMTISTGSGQTAIGVGERIAQWQNLGRNYFRYRTESPIPFRFAVSSARYAVRKESYKGKSFEIYYHPSHYENVAHLLNNAKLTMDYCQSNFGPYPFGTIRFAEISDFTRGFAATAYPATVYMTEDMIFHANIKADKQQDVVNELAGHELSHQWWGNSQVAPDNREGSPLLTETLAMYTEMMMLRKMYGKAKMLERLRMHLGIYEDEKGFAQERPLIKMHSDDTHLSYSKGAVVMYQLSELIGEDRVNLALRNFLDKNTPPDYKPVSTDLLKEFTNVAGKKYSEQINAMFTKTGGVSAGSLKQPE